MRVKAFHPANMDEDFLVVVLTEIKRLDGDLVAHIFEQGQMNRLNFVSASDRYTVRGRALAMGGGNISNG